MTKRTRITVERKLRRTQPGLMRRRTQTGLMLQKARHRLEVYPCCEREVGDDVQLMCMNHPTAPLTTRDELYEHRACCVLRHCVDHALEQPVRLYDVAETLLGIALRSVKIVAGIALALRAVRAG